MRIARTGTIARDERYGEAYLSHTVEGKEYRSKISTLRGDYQQPDGTTANRLRQWGKLDFDSQVGDILQDRLYCVQWMRPKKKRHGDEFEFRSVNDDDLQREKTVRDHVARNFAEWQSAGWMPDMRIEVGGAPPVPRPRSNKRSRLDTLASSL